MDKVSWIRWSLLGSALVATLVAVIYPDEEDAVTATTVPTKRPKSPPQVLVASPSDADTDEFEEGDPDPFAPRGWQAAPPSIESRKVVAVAAPLVEPVAPSGPPALPYRFVGSMTDGDNRLVYLGRGDQALVAHVGDVLDNTYKVTSIGNIQMEFEYLPTGQKQALAYPIIDN